MKSSLRERSKILAEINMVPFTDVVLVLLVIFMVTTPFLFQGAFQVNLPKVTAPSSNVPEAVNLSVNQAGKVFLDGNEIPLESIVDQLKALIQNNPGRQVMINADRNVSHGTVMTVMAQVYKAGVTRLGIAVEQDSSSADASKETVPSQPQ